MIHEKQRTRGDQLTWEKSMGAQAAVDSARSSYIERELRRLILNIEEGCFFISQ